MLGFVASLDPVPGSLGMGHNTVYEPQAIQINGTRDKPVEDSNYVTLAIVIKSANQVVSDVNLRGTDSKNHS